MDAAKYAATERLRNGASLDIRALRPTDRAGSGTERPRPLKKGREKLQCAMRSKASDTLTQHQMMGRWVESN